MCNMLQLQRLKIKPCFRAYKQLHVLGNRLHLFKKVKIQLVTIWFGFK